MLRRIWGYVRTAFGMRAESLMDPAVQIEQAVNEARKQDQQLREQAARVVAHRSELQMKLERAVDGAAKAKASATQALRKAKDAQAAGDQAEVDKWTRLARTLAVELETQERLVEGLKTQFGTAQQQAELAKKQVEANAFRLRELTAKRMELVGKLEQAKMQEQVNKTLDALNQPLDANAPSLADVEDKINRRMAMASAHAELEAGSLASAQQELEAAQVESAGQARLDELMAELEEGEAATEVEASSESEAARAESEPAQLEEGGSDDDARLLLEEGLRAKLNRAADQVPEERQG